MEHTNYIGKYCKYPDRAWMVYIIVDYYDTCKSCSLKIDLRFNLMKMISQLFLQID